MLINIDPILPPDLLSYMRSMGHGDKLVLCDANYPAVSTSQRVVRLDGVDIPRAATAILSVFPLDSFVPYPVCRMQIDDWPDKINEVQHALINAVRETAGPHWKVNSIDRFEFYKEAKHCFVTVVTGDTRPYGCFMFTKGVLKPDGSVWMNDSD